MEPSAKLRRAIFFVGSEYADENKQSRPCYEITKKGCEFLAHKLQGAKGTIFTARYIDRFHEMEDALKSGGGAGETVSANLEAALIQMANIVSRIPSLIEKTAEATARAVMKNEGEGESEGAAEVRIVYPDGPMRRTALNGRKVEGFPPEIRNEIDRLLDAGATLMYIEKFCRLNGYEITWVSVHNYRHRRGSR